MPWVYQYLTDDFNEFDAGPFDDFDSANIDAMERKRLGFYASQPFWVPENYKMSIDVGEIPSERRRIQ